MWSSLVVIDWPVFDDISGILQIREPVYVQALIAKTPVETFDRGVLVAGT